MTAQGTTERVAPPLPQKHTQVGTAMQARGHKWKEQRTQLLDKLQQLCTDGEQVERIGNKARDETMPIYGLQELPQDSHQRHTIQSDILHKAVRIARSRNRMRRRREKSRKSNQ
jgi:hypothetical protein